MRFALVAVALVLATPAVAQSEFPKQYTFSLTAEEIDKIWDALNRTPASYQLMKKLEQQWSVQAPKPAIAPPASAEPGK